jgi:uncharacterized membrane protein (UPF0127 family)
MIHRSLTLAVLAVLLASTLALAKPAVPVWRDAHPWSTEVATVIVGDIEVEAEIADTSALQSRGLGYRDGLASGTGMIFLFDEPAPHSFWMKGMRFCLDIIWLADNQIVGAARNVATFAQFRMCPMPIFPATRRWRRSMPCWKFPAIG